MFSRLVGRLKDHTKRIASFIMEPAGPSIGYNTDSKLISFHPIGCIFTCSSALPLSLCPSRLPHLPSHHWYNSYSNLMLLFLHFLSFSLLLLLLLLFLFLFLFLFSLLWTCSPYFFIITWFKSDIESCFIFKNGTPRQVPKETKQERQTNNELDMILIWW